MSETIPSTLSANSTLFLGHDGEFWDFWLMMSVIGAALFAIAIGVTTAGSIISHKRAASASESLLEQFKLTTSAQLADAKSVSDVANARALEAQAALERFKAPRQIAEPDKATMISSLSSLSGTKVAIYVLGDTPEPNALAISLREILNLAHLDALAWNWTGVGSAIGVVVLPKPGADIEVQSACEAIVAALNAAHVESTKQDWPGEWGQFGGMLNGPTSPGPTEAPIRIIIGAKP